MVVPPAGLAGPLFYRPFISAGVHMLRAPRLYPHNDTCYPDNVTRCFIADQECYLALVSGSRGYSPDTRR